MKILSSNKQNNNRQSANRVRSSEQLDQMKLQLKSAYAQINTLRQSNRKLMMQLELAQKSNLNSAQTNEQLTFLKEQEENMKQQLNNYQNINTKLRMQLEVMRSKNQEMHNQLQEPTLHKRRDSQDIGSYLSQKRNTMHIIRDKQASKSSVEELQIKIDSSNVSKMSFSSQKVKENHYTTPKSKMNINLEEMIPLNINQRKKVFF